MCPKKFIPSKLVGVEFDDAKRVYGSALEALEHNTFSVDDVSSYMLSDIHFDPYADN